MSVFFTYIPMCHDKHCSLILFLKVFLMLRLWLFLNAPKCQSIKLQSGLLPVCLYLILSIWWNGWMRWLIVKLKVASQFICNFIWKSRNVKLLKCYFLCSPYYNLAKRCIEYKRMFRCWFPKSTNRPKVVDYSI